MTVGYYRSDEVELLREVHASVKAARVRGVLASEILNRVADGLLGGYGGPNGHALTKRLLTAYGEYLQDTDAVTCPTCSTVLDSTDELCPHSSPVCPTCCTRRRHAQDG